VTRALRARHRRALTGLAVVLPAAVAASLAARPALPRAPLPARLEDRTPPLGRILWRGELGDARLRVRATIGLLGIPAESVTDGRPDAHREPILQVDAENVGGRPDLLLYWAPGEPNGPVLPAGALLLGALSPAIPAHLPLPAAARGPGVLIVYDLARASVAGSTRIAARAASEGEVGP
jgi:hypothetical protein